MEFIPSIANYFGVSIDALFGYDNDRRCKIEACIADIKEKDRLNNGEDVCIEECIDMAPDDHAAFTKELPSYWPFWCVPDYGDVEAALKADRRWADWCARCAAENK